MAAAKIYLRTEEKLKDKNGASPLYIRFSHSNSPRAYTGLPIHVKESDLIVEEDASIKKNGKIRSKPKDNKIRVRKNAKLIGETPTELNAEIERIDIILKRIINQYKRYPIPGLTASFLKNEFEKEYRPWKATETAPTEGKEADWENLFDVWAWNSKRSQGTIKGYMTAKNKFLEFLGGKRVKLKSHEPIIIVSPETGEEIARLKYKYEGQKKIKIADLKPQLFDQFIAWLFDIHKKEPAYVLNLYVDLRLFLKDRYESSEENEYQVNEKMLLYEPKRDITISDNQESNLWLTEEEFYKIYDHVPTSERQAKAKTLYIWMIATGLSTGDKYIDPRVDIQDGLIIKRRKKTANKNGSVQYIPLNEYSIEILNQYPDGLPKMFDQDLNEEIKILARDAGIDSVVRIVTHPGGVRKEEIIEKWRVLTSHTGRKTMATWLENNSIPDTYYNNMIGHRSSKERKRYAGMDLKVLQQFAKSAIPAKRKTE